MTGLGGRETPEKLEVLTLNTWGLWIVSKKRWRRMQHLARALAASTADVVLLQEVWVDSDVEMLVAYARTAGLEHAIHFKAGMFGSGLVTLSRYPILESRFTRYAAAGDPLAILCGDFYAAKGFGWARVHTPWGPVDTFNTHLHANYSHKFERHSGASNPTGNPGALPNGVMKAATRGYSHGQPVADPDPVYAFHVPRDTFAPYRISQVLELAQGIRQVSKSGSAAIILGGDLNCKPEFLESGLLRSLLPELVDSWSAIHGPENPAGHTCKAAGNSFESVGQVPERIDYVLAAGLRPVQARIALQMTPEGFSYSDHFGVQVQLGPLAAGAHGHIPPLLSPTDAATRPRPLQISVQGGQPTQQEGATAGTLPQQSQSRHQPQSTSNSDTTRTLLNLDAAPTPPQPQNPLIAALVKAGVSTGAGYAWGPCPPQVPLQGSGSRDTVVGKVPGSRPEVHAATSQTKASTGGTSGGTQSSTGGDSSSTKGCPREVTSPKPGKGMQLGVGGPSLLSDPQVQPQGLHHRGLNGQDQQQPQQVDVDALLGLLGSARSLLQWGVTLKKHHWRQRAQAGLAICAISLGWATALAASVSPATAPFSFISVWLAALLAPVLGALGILLFAMALVGDRGQQRTLGHSLDQLNRLIDNVVAAGQVKQH